MAIQTKQQKRAAFALKRVKEFKEDLKENSKEFHELANFIVGVPNMILSNGLGQTLAFLLTKKDKQRTTFRVIKDWLECADNHFFDEPHAKSERDFLERFTTVDQRVYLDMQDETLRLMEWLKRYARAFDDFKE